MAQFRYRNVVSLCGVVSKGDPGSVFLNVYMHVYVHSCYMYV